MKRILLMAVAMMAIFFQGQAKTENEIKLISYNIRTCLLYTSPSPRDA